jgi:flagellum-specific peptidoglycan hydrolase FlgJ
VGIKTTLYMKAIIQNVFNSLEIKLRLFKARKYARMFLGVTVLLFLIKNPPREVYDLEFQTQSFLVSNHIQSSLSAVIKNNTGNLINDDMEDDYDHLLYGDGVENVNTTKVNKVKASPPPPVPVKNNSKKVISPKSYNNNVAGAKVNYQFANLYSNIKAGTRNSKIEEFIKTYKHLAIQEARKFGHSAAIKMAQAILESKYGTSNFYKKTGHMFCIKKKVQSSNVESPYHKPDYFIIAENDLTSGIKQHTDDAPNEDFYSFDRVWNSWRFHSLFMKWRIEKHPNYMPLQKVDRRDYTAWAKYLDCYATDGSYGKNLVRMIRTYNLQELDN